MQIETSSPRAKAQQVISKCAQLFKEKKYYEFGQKVKLFSHRKLHSNKVQQALWILNIAATKLLDAGEVKEGQQLLTEWLKNIEANKNQYSQEHFTHFIEAYKIREFDGRLQLLERLTKIFWDTVQTSQKDVAIELLVQQQIRKGNYVAGEKYAVYQDLTKSRDFIKRWQKELTPQQGEFIQMRFGLLKLYHMQKEQGEAFVNQLPNTSPFRRYAELCIRCWKQKSKEGYEQLEKSYKAFIEGEPSIAKLYWTFGFLYFRMEKEAVGGGLLKIFG